MRRLMLERDGKLFYSTREAAERLGVKQASIGDAIWRGSLAATDFPDILRRHFIEAAELERYQQEHKGRRGWEKRKEPGYRPDAGRAAYKRDYPERRGRAGAATDGQ